MADAAVTSPPESMVNVQLEIDRYIWKYMNRSAKYRDKIEAIGKECDTSVTETDTESSGDLKQLSLSGGEKIPSCSSQIHQLVDECRKTVSTYTIDGHDKTTCSTVVENLLDFEDPSSALIDVDSATGVIRLTGTKTEINYALGLLEVLGVPMPSQPPAQTVASVDEAPPASLQLWREQDEDAELDSMYSPAGSGLPCTVVVDAKLWNYLQKSNGQWVAEIADVRDKMGVVITEEPSTDGALMLTLTGVDDDDVNEATERIQQLVDRCRNVVQTVHVVCPDAAVRANVLKYLPRINETRSYVDESLTATGTAQELEECYTKKLKKLGASLGSGESAAQQTAAGEDTRAGPDTSSDVKQDLMEDERIARQLQMEEDAQSHRGHLVQTRATSNPDDDSGQEGRQYGEIPVPIEETLWTFVEKRRTQQMQQLRQAYQVKISSRPAIEEGFVVIAVEAESSQMLECAQEELIQLLENLRGSVIVQVFQISDGAGDRGQQVPPQVAQLFSQMAEGTDAVIEMHSNNITVIGPEVFMSSLVFTGHQV